MERVPDLNWPTELFSAANNNSTAPLLGQRKAQTDDNYCPCGCKLPHNMAVSRVIGESNNRRVLWYRTVACRNKHAGISSAKHQEKRS